MTGFVYVVQNQHRLDRRTGTLIPKFDISPAKKYGELSFLLGPTASPFNAEPIVAELHEKLQHYSDDDYIMLIGNPCLIGWSVAIAADYNEGRVNLLQWNLKINDYIPVSATLFGDCSEGGTANNVA